MTLGHPGGDRRRAEADCGHGRPFVSVRGIAQRPTAAARFTRPWSCPGGLAEAALVEQAEANGLAVWSGRARGPSAHRMRTQANALEARLPPLAASRALCVVYGDEGTPRRSVAPPTPARRRHPALAAVRTRDRRCQRFRRRRPVLRLDAGRPHTTLLQKLCAERASKS